jgi:hypothetical protein
MARNIAPNDEMRRSTVIPLLQVALDRLGPAVTDMTADDVWRVEHLVDAAVTRIQVGVDADCRPCIHAGLFGWWGPPLLKDLNAHTHCHNCHRSWRGIKEAHCNVCHEQFASNEAAAKHWTDNRHVYPTEVEGLNGKPRFCEQPSEFGRVWVLCRFLVEDS